MNMTDNNLSDWFYIKNRATGRMIANSISVSNLDEYASSQVVVVKPKYTDDELWCWDNQCLKNKSTGLVLDIRKGKLRLIEDTEICLYYKKSVQESHNQLWAVRPAEKDNRYSTLSTDHPLFRGPTCQSSAGSLIYLTCNNDWVLDICSPRCSDKATEEEYKLIIFPQNQQEDSTQKWDIISADDMNNAEEDSFSAEPDLVYDNSSLESSMTDESYIRTPASSISCESVGFAHGLSPATRSSQTSLTSFIKKDSLEDLYIDQNQQFGQHN